MYPSYDGLTCDTRAEVLLLSSNTRIVGAPGGEWGATIVNTDYKNDRYDEYVAGSMKIDNLEVENCSQKDTYKACLRFENSLF